ncbi:hypothetical protein [Levilactobacillus andaensis]|uniref:hypothetical protein n=1 Tax=Levilactobacillus andaensis TaxID=2799570 RepID=UPI001943F803|nr:hypothetical protein [Levilactobacillus andaensis]
MQKNTIAHLRIDVVGVAMLLLASKIERLNVGQVMTERDVSKLNESLQLLENALKEEK